MSLFDTCTTLSSFIGVIVRNDRQGQGYRVPAWTKYPVGHKFAGDVK
jgi:hypothetical protein